VASLADLERASAIRKGESGHAGGSAKGFVVVNGAE